jgi:large subunit ribosomal protein L21
MTRQQQVRLPSFPNIRPSQLHPDLIRRNLSVESSRRSRFAAVDHSQAYKSQVSGRHGQQLALAELAGAGKDDPAFDPFLEDEMEEGFADEGLEGKGIEARNEDEDVDDFDDDTDGADGESFYNRDGSLRWSRAERAVLRAGSPAGGLFAVVELAGSQFKVTTDDVLIVNRLPPPFDRVGTTHEIDSVLLAGSTHLTLVGMPWVAGACVKVMVEEITKDEKVIVFRKRRRKNWKRKNGFRRDVTMLRILDIVLPPQYANHHHVVRVAPKALFAGE